MALARCSLKTPQQALASRNHKKPKMRGDVFCQPPSLEGMHPGLKRITEVGGLKIESEKDTF